MLRTEFIYFGSFGCLFGIIYAVLYIISHDWDQPDPNDIEVLYDGLYLILPSPILYCLILVQTQWVLYQFNKLNNPKKKNQDGDDGKVDNDELCVSLQDIMSDFEGYKVFMGMLYE